MSQQQQQLKEWELTAIRELMEICDWLVQGAFDSKTEFLNRLRLSTEAIELVSEEQPSFINELS